MLIAGRRPTLTFVIGVVTRRDMPAGRVVLTAGRGARFAALRFAANSPDLARKPALARACPRLPALARACPRLPAQITDGAEAIRSLIARRTAARPRLAQSVSRLS